MRISDNCPLPPGAVVWVYLRDSGGSGQERSVEQQTEVARAYCEKHRLVLEELFADQARTGSNADNRDELLRMLALVRERFKPIHDRKRREEVATQIQRGIIFWMFSRLGRDTIESGAIRYDLRMRGL